MSKRITRAKFKVADDKDSATMSKIAKKEENKQNDEHQQSSIPIAPDVRLIKLPFYDLKAVLLQPSSLIPSSTGKLQRQIFKFNLTPSFATEIEKFKIMNNGIAYYYVQVQLRLCLSETTSEQKDHYPFDVCVKVNDKECALPPLLPTRPGTPAKRPHLPLDITNLIKISSMVSNKISIAWRSEVSKNFAVSVYLVHKLESSSLMKRLEAKGIKPDDFTRGLIKEKFKTEDSDNEIATTVLRVSLACPLGKARMKIPCRATTCKHLQCFDAATFLYMNEKKSSWKCPVCDQPALFENLSIDGYFLDVINSQTLGSDEEIQLHKDGSWSSFGFAIKDEKKEYSEKEAQKESIEIISDEEDDDEEDVPKKVEVVEKENPIEIKKALKTNIADQPENRRSKRAAAASSNRMYGLKRVKTHTNILLQRDNNQNSETIPDSSSEGEAIAPFQLATMASIDLTLDDD